MRKLFGTYRMALVVVIGLLPAFYAKSYALPPDQQLLEQKAEIAQIAETLRQESLQLEGKIRDILPRLFGAVATLKRDPGRGVSANAVLDHLAYVFNQFPLHIYCAGDPAEMVRVITRQIAFALNRVASVSELPIKVKEAIVLPEDAILYGDFPEDIPLEKFKRLAPITIFLMKHRMNFPGSVVAARAGDLASGKYNVGVGVVLRGKVRNIHRFDGDDDIVFDIEMIHCEITPTWRQRHPDMLIPKEGDLVELAGWSYYDIFHADESQEENVGMKKRQTVWEVHPVQKIVALTQRH